MDDPRNVIDYYKYWKTDAIKADLDQKRHNFSILISNKFTDFNIGSVIRNANAFLAREVFIYGRRQFDRRGTVGAHLYENLKVLREIEELSFPDSYVIGVDNIGEAKAIETYEWPKDKHVIMVFGQEDIGLTDELKAICKEFIYIKQYGSVRSLNVGCASAITMFDYCRKNYSS
jgi:tRNA G18 (ribose-2'-O)-methylase SpoU